MDGLKEKMFPVLLPTEKVSNLTIALHYNNELRKVHDNYKCKSTDEIFQHLYICSDRDTKMEDQKIVLEHNRGAGSPYYRIYRKGHLETIANIPSSEKSEYWIKSIVASTDKSLGLPELSKEFIEAYIKAHNAGTPITEVMVDMEEALAWTTENNKVWPNATFRAKVDKNNTITITKVVETWEDIYGRYCQQQMEGNLEEMVPFEVWLKQNYNTPTKIK